MSWKAVSEKVVYFGCVQATRTSLTTVREMVLMLCGAIHKVAPGEASNIHEHIFKCLLILLLLRFWLCEDVFYVTINESKLLHPLLCSLRLTAYVAKVFAIAQSLVDIKTNEICGAVKFLILHAQLPDGMFREVGQVSQGQMTVCTLISVTSVINWCWNNY